MAKIMFAWELGAGYGHAHRMASIARPLAARGHSIGVVAQNVPLVRSTFLGVTSDIEAAPIIGVPMPSERYADSYAEVLLRCGFADPVALGARLDAWKRLLDRHAPNLVVVDFAPTAMLAARLAGVPVAAVENGYSLPPAQDPLPFTRAWETIAPDRLQSLDREALASINASLVARGGAPLERLAGLFDVEARLLCTFPELDHYQDRGEADYFGPIYAQQTGVSPDWPDLPGPLVFAYLDPGHPAFDAILVALERKGWPTVLHARGAAASANARAVRLHALPVHLDQALAQCDLVLCQGLATVSAALLAGRPIVQLPGHLEQAMILHRVVCQGLGVGVLRDAGLEAISVALDLVHDDAGYARRAASFSRHYHGFTSTLAAESVAEQCAALL